MIEENEVWRMGTAVQLESTAWTSLQASFLLLGGNEL